ncbi:serine/threonine-protein kinase LMTK1 isoform X1 [Pleurodeles waltl]|uniref:serine/threonine-protein kinase LMTK1 isoform X1 n=1 Tax=Pleurodeles waltl TaxID=8319 RepID=UPI0037095C2E
MGLAADLLAFAMSSSLFNPSFAFSSHFDPDGAPLSELSWSSSLAVVVVSFSGLFTFIFLMLACLCCKKGDGGFKEFDNAEGEEFPAEFSAQGSPAAQNGPEVYVLPLTEVSLPMSKQPGRSVQLLKSADLGRHSLLYLKEIGQGWFGKVLLGEVNSGLSSTQVVVKELKVSASVQEQMQFLEEMQPYRALQHPNLLQCLAQCAEVTPYLLVMEFCPLGDLKSYLRSCRAADPMALDPLTLQRMACEISCGLQHLHKNNYVHSDLALRNCLLTADLTVKIGDYGLSQCKFKEDYFVTADQLSVPLRWTAPELIDEVHGNLLVVDQTKASNIWSLGVTVWELFELGSQPYHHYSDKQVLTYAIKEEQLKLPKPQMTLSLSDRWYEVMQFCWLQAEQRPTAEEVHLLLSYLCLKGTTEAEEEFEKRWESLKPHSSASHRSTRVSSFPLLAHFSGDAFHTDGDDILTVTETSQGLNFEYKWEPSKPDHFHALCGNLSPGNAHYQDIYCSATSSGRLSLGVSPSGYERKPECQSLKTHGVVPVLSAHSPSVSSEYYIRIEEPSDCHADLDYTMCSYSPEYNRLSPNKELGWTRKKERGDLYDSDNSSSVFLTMEPLLGQDPPPSDTWENSDFYPASKHKSKALTYYEQSPSDGADQCLLEDDFEAQDEWKTSCCKKTAFEDPLGVSPTMNCSFRKNSRSNSYEDERDAAFAERLMELTRQKLAASRHHVKSPVLESVIVELEDEGICENPSPRDEMCPGDQFTEEAQSPCWSSNCSSNNNISNCCPPRPPDDSTNTDAWCNRRTTQCRGAVTEPFGPESWQNTDLVDALWENNVSPTRVHRPAEEEESVQADCGSEVHWKFDIDSTPGKKDDLPGLGSIDREQHLNPSVSPDLASEALGSLLGTFSQETVYSDFSITRQPDAKEDDGGCASLMQIPNTETPNADLARSPETNEVTCSPWDTEPQLSRNVAILSDVMEDSVGSNSETGITTSFSTTHSHEQIKVQSDEAAANSLRDLPSEMCQTLTYEPDATLSSMSFNETDNGSDDDDDTTELTSGIFMDFSSDYPEHADTAPLFKSLQKQVGTPDSLESLDIPSVASSCDACSPVVYNLCNQPRALDSGYDTENYESPEFVLKEPHETREPDAAGEVTKSSSNSTLADVDGPASDMHMSSSFSSELHVLDEKNPYRDSAYFSDFDADTDRYLKEEEDEALELEFHEKKEEPPVLTTLKRGLDEPHSPESTLEAMDLKCDIPEDAPTGMSSSDLSDTPTVVDLNTLGKTKIPISPTLTDGDLGKGTLLTQGTVAKAESLDEGLGMECSRGVSTAHDLLPVAKTHDLPSRTFLLTSVELTQEDRLLSGLKEKSVQGLDGIVLDGGSLAGVCKDKTKLVPSQRFKVKISTLDGHDVGPLESRCSPEAEGRVVWQGDPAAGQISLDVSLLHGKKETRQGPVDRLEEADEDEDTEDSDESDEELCCYNIQEPSEDSEEELSTAPVIIAESHSARNLRSLLKIPSLVPHTFCEDFERKKKAVSFFDDVTVYLFDQESPTKDLGEQDFPTVTDSCPLATVSPLERLNTSDDSSDGNVSEESGGFEWDDDFPLMAVTPSFPSSLTPVDSVLATTAQAQKQVVPVHFSRFTVSPAAVSRFSITHVSDSDMESAGGSSEDGERE